VAIFYIGANQDSSEDTVDEVRASGNLREIFVHNDMIGHILGLFTEISGKEYETDEYVNYASHMSPKRVKEVGKQDKGVKKKLKDLDFTTTKLYDLNKNPRSQDVIQVAENTMLALTKACILQETGWDMKNVKGSSNYDKFVVLHGTEKEYTMEQPQKQRRAEQFETLRKCHTYLEAPVYLDNNHSSRDYPHKDLEKAVTLNNDAAYTKPTFH